MDVSIGKESEDILNAYLFAVEQVLNVEEYEDMEFMIRKLLQGCEKRGMKINL